MTGFRGFCVVAKPAARPGLLLRANCSSVRGRSGIVGTGRNVAETAQAPDYLGGSVGGFVVHQRLTVVSRRRRGASRPVPTDELQARFRLARRGCVWPT